MSEWQPMETAPKDGTPILAFLPPEDEPDFERLCDFVVTWWETQQHFHLEPSKEHPGLYRRVLESVGHWVCGSLPICWMPLPPSPQQVPTSGQEKP